MAYHNHAWRRVAPLFMAIFSVCLGASAQNAADKTPQGMQSPLPVSVLPSTQYKLDLSLKTNSFEKVSFPGQGAALATAAMTTGSDGTFRLTLDQAQQAAAGVEGKG